MKAVAKFVADCVVIEKRRCLCAQHGTLRDKARQEGRRWDRRRGRCEHRAVHGTRWFNDLAKRTQDLKQARRGEVRNIFTHQGFGVFSFLQNIKI
jgi:hypothetical protein